MSLLCIRVPVFAAETELPVAKVAISDDQSIVIERVLFEALKRSGYQMVSKVTGMRTAVADVNYGDAAILPLQTDGWEALYENLLKVPEDIDQVEFTAYTRGDDSHQFSEWGDMAGLRLGYRNQNQYVANKVEALSLYELVKVNEIEELWAALFKHEADVVVLPRMSHFEHRFPDGVRRAGVVEAQLVYTYVNKAYADLVPLLDAAYKGMKSDGTLASIHDGRRLSGGRQTVLHINSYNAQNDWERGQMEAIRGSLEPGTALEYYSFNLNTNELHSQAGFNAVVSDMIRTNFVARSPDLIIASGNEAFEFTLNYYYLLFPNVPVIFFGVQGFESSMLHGLENHVAGVPEKAYFYETVSEMLRLYPNTRRIYILNGNTLQKSIKLGKDIHAKLQDGA